MILYGAHSNHIGIVKILLLSLIIGSVLQLQLWCQFTYLTSKQFALILANVTDNTFQTHKTLADLTCLFTLNKNISNVRK